MALRTRLLLAVLAAAIGRVGHRRRTDLHPGHPGAARPGRPGAGTGAPADRTRGGRRQRDRERAIRDAAPGFYVELQDPDGADTTVIPLQRPGDDAITLSDADLPSPGADDAAGDGTEDASGGVEDGGGGRRDDEAVFASVAATGDHGLRVRVSRQSDGSILIIGRSLQSVEDTRERLLVVLLAASAGAVAVAGLLGAGSCGSDCGPLPRSSGRRARSPTPTRSRQRSRRRSQHRGGTPRHGDQSHARPVGA